jgi:sterol 24-C-methyltransferase
LQCTNPEDEFQRKVKHEIEKGDSLPDLTSEEHIVECFKKAGFEVLDSFDVALEYKQKVGVIPWYSTLEGSFQLSQLKHTYYGRKLTQTMVDVLETVRIAPKGTSQTHQMLCKAAEYLAIGGRKEIFTPMLFVIGRKPL